MKKCINCGKEMEDTVLFCPKCLMNNVVLKEHVDKEFDISEQKTKLQKESQPIQKTQEASKIKYDTDKMCIKYARNPILFNKQFSFLTFIFGSLYYFYRKMYLKGLFLLLYQIFLYTVYSMILKLILLIPVKFISFILAVLVFVIFIIIWVKKCKKFSTEYYNFCMAKVRKIYYTSSNQTQDELEKICQKKGGVNIILPVFLIIVYSMLMGGLVYIYINYDKVSNEYAKIIYKKNRVMNYEVPKEFEKTYEKYDEGTRVGIVIYTYYNMVAFQKCEMKVSNISNPLGLVPFFNSSKRLINQYAINISLKDYEISKKNVKNVTWYHTSYKTENRNEDIKNVAYESTYYDVYSTEKHGYAYLVVFESNEDKNCYEYSKTILDTVSFKK